MSPDARCLMDEKEYLSSSSCSEKSRHDDDQQKMKAAPSSVSKFVSSLLPTLQPPKRPPKIHVYVSSESSISLSGGTPMAIKITFVLEEGFPPLTIYTLRTLFSDWPHHGPHDLSFVDTESKETYQPRRFDIRANYDPRMFDIAYRNKRYFTTLHPTEPFSFSRGWWPPLIGHNLVPMQANREYRTEFNHRTTDHVWWCCGRKWQILRWRFWPFGSPERTQSPKMPGIEFVFVQTCTFKTLPRALQLFG